jgi:hypothetical protein
LSGPPRAAWGAAFRRATAGYIPWAGPIVAHAPARTVNDIPDVGNLAVDKRRSDVDGVQPPVIALRLVGRPRSGASRNQHP